MIGHYVPVEKRIEILSGKKIEEGFYMDVGISPGRIFYLSREKNPAGEGDNWYFQFAWNNEPQLLTISSCNYFRAVKVNPQEALEWLQDDRELIGSKLETLLIKPQA